MSELPTICTGFQYSGQGSDPDFVRWLMWSRTCG